MSEEQEEEGKTTEEIEGEREGERNRPNFKSRAATIAIAAIGREVDIIEEEAGNGREEEAGQGEGAHGAGEEARAPISPGRKANLLADLTRTTHHQFTRMKTTPGSGF